MLVRSFTLRMTLLFSFLFLIEIMNSDGSFTTPAKAVDGRFSEANFAGFHSEREDEPFLVVDLGMKQEILMARLETRQHPEGNFRNRFQGIQASIY